MRKILLLANADFTIYNFRLELVQKLIESKYEVIIVTPEGEKTKDLKKLGCKCININLERHGTNPLDELSLIKKYKIILESIKPDVILGFTIKPNIYGGICSSKYPFIANITGLGTSIETTGVLQKFLLFLYSQASKNYNITYFQNNENYNFFKKNRLIKNKYRILPGSGVNLEKFSLRPYPSSNIIKFAFISRIMEEKGIDSYLQTALYFKKLGLPVEFHICGFFEDEKYKPVISKLEEENIIIYHGMIEDIPAFLQDIHCLIHPTYYPEGLSNVLLEASAIGRPIITTNRSGCREVVQDGINGYMIPAMDTEALIKKTKEFLELKPEEKEQMGKNARKIVEQKFDRKIVVDTYLEDIERLIKENE